MGLQAYYKIFWPLSREFRQEMGLYSFAFMGWQRLRPMLQPAQFEQSL